MQRRRNNYVIRQFIFEDFRKLSRSKLSILSAGEIARGNCARLTRVQGQQGEQIAAVSEEIPASNSEKSIRALFFGQSCRQLSIRKSSPGESSPDLLILRADFFVCPRDARIPLRKWDGFAKTLPRICSFFLSAFLKQMLSTDLVEKIQSLERKSDGRSPLYF